MKIVNLEMLITNIQLIVTMKMTRETTLTDSCVEPNQKGSQSMPLDEVSIDSWSSVCSNRCEHNFTDGEKITISYESGDKLQPYDVFKKNTDEVLDLILHTSDKEICENIHE